MSEPNDTPKPAPEIVLDPAVPLREGTRVLADGRLAINPHIAAVLGQAALLDTLQQAGRITAEQVRELLARAVMETTLRLFLGQQPAAELPAGLFQARPAGVQ